MGQHVSKKKKRGELVATFVEPDQLPPELRAQYDEAIAKGEIEHTASGRLRYLKRSSSEVSEAGSERSAISETSRRYRRAPSSRVSSRTPSRACANKGPLSNVDVVNGIVRSERKRKETDSRCSSRQSSRAASREPRQALFQKPLLKGVGPLMGVGPLGGAGKPNIGGGTVVQTRVSVTRDNDAESQPAKKLTREQIEAKIPESKSSVPSSQICVKKSCCEKQDQKKENKKIFQPPNLSKGKVNADEQLLRNVGKPSFIKLSFIDYAGSAIVQQFYEVYTQKPLGKGSFGEVWLAQTKPTTRHEKKKLRAIKKLKKPDDKTQIAVLKKEVEIIRSINHPTMIRCFETFEDRNHIYLVLEYCRGGMLTERLKSCGEEEAARWLKEMLGGLGYLHKCKIVHRDVKPDNFLFETKEKDSKVKMIDFGLADRFDKQRLTEAVGTPYYVAPEVLRVMDNQKRRSSRSSRDQNPEKLERLEKEYTEKCDIWSVGVIAFQMFCKKRPFEGSVQEIFAQIKNKPLSAVYQSVPSFATRMSVEARDLLSVLMTRNVAVRLTAEQAAEHAFFCDLWRPQEGQPSLSDLLQTTKDRIQSEMEIFEGSPDKRRQNATPIKGITPKREGTTPTKGITPQKHKTAMSTRSGAAHKTPLQTPQKTHRPASSRGHTPMGVGVLTPSKQYAQATASAKKTPVKTPVQTPAREQVGKENECIATRAVPTLL